MSAALIWTVLKVNGETERQPGPMGLEALQAAVGGWIEPLTCEGGTMFVNEEGLIQTLEENPWASALAGRRIVGDVVFVNRYGVAVIGRGGQRVATTGRALVLENARRS